MIISIYPDQTTDLYGRVTGVFVRAAVETRPCEGYDNSKLAELERDLGKFVEGRLNDAIARGAER